MSEEIKIEKGVPVAPARFKWPFGQMEVGDSFFTTENSRKPRNAGLMHSKRHGGRFTCRTVTENGVKGIRVWRTA